MNSFVRALGLTSMTLWSLGAAAEVFSPGNQRNGLDDLNETDVEHGVFSVGYANTLAYNNDSQPGIMFTARYFAGEKWYLLGEAQLGQFSTRAVINDGQEVRSDDEELLRYSAGAGYSLLQGTASTSGVRAVPWVLAAELHAGEQHSGDTSGRYASLCMTVQFHGERIWTGLGVREFLVDDERLQSLESDGGTQWDISLGLYY